jgi:hypothetical protein
VNQDTVSNEVAHKSRGRRPSTFRQSDLARAVKVAKALGAERVEVDKNGKIAIITAKGDSATPSLNPWDEAVAKLAA